MTAAHSAQDSNPRHAGFWDRVAERYAKRPISDEAAYRRKLEATQALMRPEMEVLEFGCGTGSTALLHAPFVKRILATDISSKMIEIAEAKAAAEGIANVTFQRAAFDEIAPAEPGFDMVLGLNILHLLPDRDAGIARVHRLLKPGGLFVSSTVCLGDGMAYFKLIAPLGRALGLMPLVRVFKVEDLLASLTRGGFQIEQQWQPGAGKRFKSVFAIARKVSSNA
ncbi:MAG: hypothetical protein Kilf2KO_39400 [Rhodospirillales bacterium]